MIDIEVLFNNPSLDWDTFISNLKSAMRFDLLIPILSFSYALRLFFKNSNFAHEMIKNQIKKSNSSIKFIHVFHKLLTINMYRLAGILMIGATHLLLVFGVESAMGKKLTDLDYYITDLLYIYILNLCFTIGIPLVITMACYIAFEIYNHICINNVCFIIEDRCLVWDSMLSCIRLFLLLFAGIFLNKYFIVIFCIYTIFYMDRNFKSI